MAKTGIVTDAPDTPGEGPQWNLADGTFYRVDAFAPAIRLIDPATSAGERFARPGDVVCSSLRAMTGPSPACAAASATRLSNMAEKTTEAGAAGVRAPSMSFQVEHEGEGPAKVVLQHQLSRVRG